MQLFRWLYTSATTSALLHVTPTLEDSGVKMNTDVLELLLSLWADDHCWLEDQLGSGRDCP